MAKSGWKIFVESDRKIDTTPVDYFIGKPIDAWIAEPEECVLSFDKIPQTILDKIELASEAIKLYREHSKGHYGCGFVCRF